MKTASSIHGRSPTWRDLPIDLISRAPLARWAPIPLRLIVGYGFMEHGFAKLARGLEAFPAILQALGVPAPHVMGWLTILVEIGGGVAVLLGALVPLASIPMAAVLLVAMITVPLPLQGQDPFDKIPARGVEKEYGATRRALAVLFPPGKRIKEGETSPPPSGSVNANCSCLRLQASMLVCYACVTV